MGPLLPRAQVIPLVLHEKPVETECYSIYAAQQGLPFKCDVMTHPYLLAFALTDFKLQGRTLPKLILNFCNRKRRPHMELRSVYVLVSRVRESSGLRLLYRDVDGLAKVKAQESDESLHAWERGWDHNGKWCDELAKQALQERRERREKAESDAKAARAAQSKKRAAQRANEAAERRKQTKARKRPAQSPQPPPPQPLRRSPRRPPPPPPPRRSPRRRPPPPTTREPQAREVSRARKPPTCSKCRRTGHNARACPFES